MGEMNELVAPESIRVVIGSALEFKIVISMWSSACIFLKPIPIDSILNPLGGDGAAHGPLTLFLTPLILVPLPVPPSLIPSFVPPFFRWASHPCLC